MATASKPHLDCICCEHRAECDCVSDDFKLHALKVREYDRVERRDSRIALVGVIAFIILIAAVVL